MLPDLFGSRLRAKLVAWLFSHPDERYFARRLERLLNEDPTNMGRELARLAEMGILTSQVEGRQKYYQANPDCPVYEELKGLVVKTLGIADVLRNALYPLEEHITLAFIYGSFANGKQHLDSDVDVMLVGEVTFADVVATTGRAQLKLDREVNPTVYSLSEFREKVASGHHFLRNVLDGPKVFIIGDERELAGVVGERLAEEG